MVAIVDLDTDGAPDILTGNSDGTISFLEGDGAGGFLAPVVFSSGLTAARAMAVGTIDAGPAIDVAMSSNSYPYEVHVLLGTGTGSFQQPSTLSPGIAFQGLALADANQDGTTDLIAAASGSGSVGLMLGDGAGGFGTLASFTAGRYPVQPLVADLDRDGIPDVAVTSNASLVSVLKGVAGGTFRAATSSAVQTDVIRVVATDVDGDGDLDLVAMDDFELLVLMANDGAGAFLASAPTGTRNYGANDLIGADVNGDGRLDLVASESYRSQIGVFLATGGGFTGPVGSATDTGPKALAAGDFDADGDIDVAAVTAAQTVSVLLGNGDGTFQAPINVFVGSSPAAVVAIDLNGDGFADLAIPRSTSSDVAILIGNGDGTFQAARIVALGPGQTLKSIEAGLFNADAFPDLAVSGGSYTGPGTLWTLLGNGNGTFQPPLSIAIDSGIAESIVPCDVDANGAVDLALGVPNIDVVAILVGAGDGTFSSLGDYDAGEPVGLAVADFNSDGSDDLATANRTLASVSVTLTTGLGMSPGSLPSGFIGVPYSQTLGLPGGTPPITFALLSGSLPPGLALSPAGVIAGTPIAYGSFPFAVQATDASPCTATHAYTIVIDSKVAYLTGQGLGQPNPNRVRLYGKGGAGSGVDFFAYGAGQWGVNVASGNTDGGAYDEILTGPGPGAVFGPQVRAFDRTGATIGKVNFYAYGALRYGVNVAATELDGDSFDEILSGAGPGVVFGPHVRAFNFDGGNVTPIPNVSYFAYSTLQYGVNVSGGDVDGDGFGEITRASPQGHLRTCTCEDGTSTAAASRRSRRSATGIHVHRVWRQRCPRRRGPRRLRRACRCSRPGSTPVPLRGFELRWHGAVRAAGFRRDAHRVALRRARVGIGRRASRRQGRPLDAVSARSRRHRASSSRTPTRGQRFRT
ncbi:MAG: FG-GAP-like repeat-containing protein [Acidobacteriota bacterium]